ncbi:hypothetical protein EDD86DRAFT_137034 [Gorgonomyces haynaldii]|nr:hypothetical protein EDD86DRAFT_137034 [Gorgonomyces haynaldii]
MECNHLETLDDFVESVEQFQTIGPLLLPLMDIARSGVKPIILESVQRWIQSHAEHIPVFMGVVQPSIEYCVDTQSPLLDCIQVSARQLVRFFHAGMKWIPSSDLVNIYEIFGQWTQSKASASFPWRQLLEELGSVPQEHHQVMALTTVSDTHLSILLAETRVAVCCLCSTQTITHYQHSMATNRTGKGSCIDGSHTLSDTRHL